MKKIKNKKRKFGSALYYFQIKAKGVFYLFTEDEIENARMRALTNPEDLDKSKSYTTPILIGIVFLFGILIGQIIY